MLNLRSIELLDWKCDPQCVTNLIQHDSLDGINQIMEHKPGRIWYGCAALSKWYEGVQDKGDYLLTLQFHWIWLGFKECYHLGRLKLPSRSLCRCIFANLIHWSQYLLHASHQSCIHIATMRSHQLELWSKHSAAGLQGRLGEFDLYFASNDPKPRLSAIHW